MSGHSHWTTIKRTKEAEDKKRGKIFSKLSRLISLAAKQGSDPETNPKLKGAIEKAKECNMPKENIERAIKKATGELGAQKLEEVAFEALGPGGIALIIEGITDNKNRTLNEIKQILNQYNAKLTEGGAVKWMFERKGIIIINPESQDKEITKEELELLAIEAGAEDIRWSQGQMEVYTKPEDLDKTRKQIEEKEIKTDSCSLGWVPKEEITLEEKQKTSCLKLFESLSDNDDVQEIYSNLRL